MDGYGALELTHTIYRRAFAGLIKSIAEGTDPRENRDVLTFWRWHLLCEANIAAAEAAEAAKTREQLDSLNRPPPGYEGFMSQERNEFGQLIGPNGETYVPRWSEIGRR